MMNIQLTTPQVIEILVLWFILGAALDFSKLILITMGKYTSFVPRTIKDKSQLARKGLNNVSRKAKIEIVDDFVKTIRDILKKIKDSLLSWSNNFIEQVVGRSSDNEFSTGTSSVFDNKYAGQKIIGALIEFVALIAFLYADASQAAQTYSLLFTTATIPNVLNNIIVPLIVASAGTAFILGIFIGDILHLTHYGNLGNLKGKTRAWFLGAIIGNLIVTVVLSALIALYRADVLDMQSESIKTIAVYSQSLVIVPMLITTVLLLRGAFGIFVILAIFLWLLAIPFAVFESFVDVFGKLIDVGTVGIDFLFAKIVRLTFAALELIFALLESILQGSFLVLISLTTIVFYIPYLVVNLTVEKISGGKRLKDYFDSLEHIDLQILDDNAQT